MAKGKYKILDETLFTVNQKTGQRELKHEYLEQVLDDIAECFGGWSICRGGLIVIDANGVKYLGTPVEVEGTVELDFNEIEA